MNELRRIKKHPTKSNTETLETKLLKVLRLEEYATQQAVRKLKPPLSFESEEDTSLKTLAEYIFRLIEETTALREMMLHKFTCETIPRIPRVNVLNRADRSAAFLASFSSKFKDCPFYLDDLPNKCIVNCSNSLVNQSWDCLGLSFFRGVPCEQLWPILRVDKEENYLSLFDLPDC